eukprot:m.82748 g.82748  ORF g.82748 m.82748 type:complete len:230 (-) comp11133_c0_seq1:35-724(-)
MRPYGKGGEMKVEEALFCCAPHTHTAQTGMSPGRWVYIVTANTRVRPRAAVAVGSAEGFHFPIEAAERVLESVLREAQSAGDDPTAPRPAPVSGVWESDGSVQPELLAQVQQRARELAASRPRDYHPGSDGLVIDVLHPSMACYVSGVTVIPRPVLRTVERVAFPHVEKGTVYQWLPSAVDVAADGTVRFRSCVPGFYARSANGELYATLESALTSFIPLFERVLHTVR